MSSDGEAALGQVVDGDLTTAPMADTLGQVRAAAVVSPLRDVELDAPAATRWDRTARLADAGRAVAVLTADPGRTVPDDRLEVQDQSQAGALDARLRQEGTAAAARRTRAASELSHCASVPVDRRPRHPHPVVHVTSMAQRAFAASRGTATSPDR